MQWVDAQLAEYLAALDAADAAEPVPPSLSRAELQAKIAALQDKRDWHEELLARLDADQAQISVTDPDARWMRTAQGSVVGDNVQAAVDQKHKLIVAQDLTNEETDLRQLSGMAKEGQFTSQTTRGRGRYRLLHHRRSGAMPGSRHYRLCPQGRYQRQHDARQKVRRMFFRGVKQPSDF